MTAGVFVALLTAVVAGQRAAAQAALTSKYTIVDLGTLGGAWSEAVAISANGHVVGNSETSDGSVHAFSWTEAGGMVDLGTLGGGGSEASAVNARGQAVGMSETSDGEWHGFSWTKEGGIVDIGTLSGTNEIRPLAVGSSGEVVGDASGQICNGDPPDCYGYDRAFLWTQHGGMVDLGTLPAEGLWYELWSAAVAVSVNGRVVGTSITADGNGHAFSWTKSGGMVDIHALGLGSDAIAVSPTGQIAGVYSPDGTYSRAFSWTKAEGMVDLGTLGGASATIGGFFPSPHAISAHGQIVGGSATSDGEYHAFSWTKEGGMVDVGKDLGPFSSAVAVSPSGQVAGYADHAFSWTEEGGVVDLGALTPDGGSFARDMNWAGQIVGSSWSREGNLHAVLWQYASTWRNSIQELKASTSGPSFAF